MRIRILMVLLVLLFEGQGLLTATTHTLRAGFATADITPPLGVDLLAFAENRKATAVHDRLMAHAVVLEADGKRIAIVGVDLCGVTLEFTEKIRAEVERATAIPGERVMVNASHTHSGPATMKWLNLIGEMDEGYMKDLHVKVAQAIILAAQKLQAVTVFYGQAPVEAVAINREYGPTGPVDKNVRVLKFMRANQVVGFIANYSVHPLTVGQKSPGLISGDLVAVAVARVLADYPGAIGIFLQGCAGDQNPAPCCSDDKDGLESLERLSALLAGRIRMALQDASPVNINGIDMEARSIVLPRVALDESMVVLRLLNAQRSLRTSSVGERAFQLCRFPTRVLRSRTRRG